MSARILKPVNQHCYDLAEALGAIDPYDSMLEVDEWLRVAAAIKNVDFDWIRFDAQFGFCSGADNYELAKQQVVKGFVTNLTVFTYVWGALEAAVDLISPQPHPDNTIYRAVIVEIVKGKNLGFELPINIYLWYLILLCQENYGVAGFLRRHAS